MQLVQIAERAKAQLATATSLEPLLVSRADEEAGGWRLTVEMLELDRIPESHSVVGSYDVRLTSEGDLVTWHRTGLRRRDETDWSPEAAEVAEVAVPSPRVSAVETSRGV